MKNLSQRQLLRLGIGAFVGLGVLLLLRLVTGILPTSVFLAGVALSLLSMGGVLIAFLQSLPEHRTPQSSSKVSQSMASKFLVKQHRPSTLLIALCDQHLNAQMDEVDWDAIGGYQEQFAKGDLRSAWLRVQTATGSHVINCSDLSQLRQVDASADPWLDDGRVQQWLNHDRGIDLGPVPDQPPAIRRALRLSDPDLLPRMLATIWQERCLLPGHVCEPQSSVKCIITTHDVFLAVTQYARKAGTDEQPGSTALCQALVKVASYQDHHWQDDLEVQQVELEHRPDQWCELLAEVAEGGHRMATVPADKRHWVEQPPIPWSEDKLMGWVEPVSDVAARQGQGVACGSGGMQ